MALSTIVTSWVALMKVYTIMEALNIDPRTLKTLGLPKPWKTLISNELIAGRSSGLTNENGVMWWSDQIADKKGTLVINLRSALEKWDKKEDPILPTPPAPPVVELSIEDKIKLLEEKVLKIERFLNI
jgi:hypothetical protein